MKRLGKCRGFSLIEVLVAFVVLSVGLLALGKLQATTTRSSGHAKAHSEALAAAEQKLEELRNFTDYSTVAASSGSENLDGTNASFSRSWTITDTSSNPAYKTVAVTVRWQDVDNTTQQVQLRTYMADPAPREMARLLAIDPPGADNEANNNPGADELADDDGHHNEDERTDNRADGSDTHEGETTELVASAEDTTPSPYTLSISGSIEHHGGSGIQVSGMSITGNYSGTCSYSSYSYICEVVNIPNNKSWSGQVMITSNKTVCAPPANPTPYRDISSNQVQNYNLGKQSEDCP